MFRFDEGGQIPAFHGLLRCRLVDVVRWVQPAPPTRSQKILLVYIRTALLLATTRRSRRFDLRSFSCSRPQAEIRCQTLPDLRIVVPCGFINRSELYCRLENFAIRNVGKILNTIYHRPRKQSRAADTLPIASDPLTQGAGELDTQREHSLDPIEHPYISLVQSKVKSVSARC